MMPSLARELSGWLWPSSAALAADIEHELLEIPAHGAPDLADLPAELLTDPDERRGRPAGLGVKPLILGQGRAAGRSLGPGLGKESGASSGALRLRPGAHSGSSADYIAASFFR